MIIYDTETYPNCFLLQAESLDREDFTIWEISDFRDDRKSLYDWFCFLQHHQIPMIGFNNLEFDYTVIHHVFHNIFTVTAAEIYQCAQRIFQSQQGQFRESIYQSNRFAPQIDLYKIHHFDNVNKSTSLKALEFNMRSFSVQDLPFEPGTVLTKHEIDTVLRPYGRHDVKETKRFAKITMPMIKFRQELIERGMVRGDLLNFNDTKIGKEYLIQRLGDACYHYENGRKVPTGTYRHVINLAEIILPYIRFSNPEFQRIHQWMMQQRITETKGVFEGVTAHVGGITFVFGTGGIHGSVHNRAFTSDENYTIVDIDVESLYPSVAIVNQLSPAHLGAAFVTEYAALKERRLQYAKDTPENGMLKLALNGSYGDSNNIHSRGLYDPQFTMSITINGQLLLAMLAEWLLTVPTITLIQCNTDGITFRIHRSFEGMANEICKQWEQFTLLKLEYAHYSRMWIRDVNNYVAEKKPGDLKTKGAYFAPKDHAEIQKQKPPGWHQNYSNLVSVRAAIERMTNGTDIETFIRGHKDPFDFMIRHKVKRDCKLTHGGNPTQRTGRHYVTVRGSELIKTTPVKAPYVAGNFKKAASCSEREYREYHNLIGNVWCEGIHTKNKSKYDDGRTNLQSGRLVSLCNDASDFRADIIDYDFYIQEAKKLLIGN